MQNSGKEPLVNPSMNLMRWAEKLSHRGVASRVTLGTPQLFLLPYFWHNIILRLALLYQCHETEAKYFVVVLIFSISGPNLSCQLSFSSLQIL